MITILQVFAVFLFLVGVAGMFIAISWIYLSYVRYVPKTIKLAPTEYLDVSFNGSAPQDSITVISDHGILMEAKSSFPFQMKINDSLENERSSDREPPPIGWRDTTCYSMKYELCKKLILTKGQTVFVRFVNTYYEEITIVQSLKKTAQRQFGYAGIGLLIVAIFAMLMAYGFFFDARTIFML